MFDMCFFVWYHIDNNGGKNDISEIDFATT